MLADKEHATIQRTSFLSGLRFVNTDETKFNSMCGRFEHVNVAIKNNNCTLSFFECVTTGSVMFFSRNRTVYNSYLRNY